MEMRYSEQFLGKRLLPNYKTLFLKPQLARQVEAQQLYLWPKQLLQLFLLHRQAA
jgi:hypothetical protein